MRCAIEELVTYLGYCEASVEVSEQEDGSFVDGQSYRWLRIFVDDAAFDAMCRIVDGSVDRVQVYPLEERAPVAFFATDVAATDVGICRSGEELVGSLGVMLRHAARTSGAGGAPRQRRH